MTSSSGRARRFGLGRRGQGRLFEPLARAQDGPQPQDQKDRDPGKNQELDDGEFMRSSSAGWRLSFVKAWQRRANRTYVSDERVKSTCPAPLSIPVPHMPLLIAFLVLPIVEIALFILVGGWIGLWPTIGLVLLAAVGGTALMRSAGAQAGQRVRASMMQDTDPSEAIVRMAMSFVAGMLLVIPVS